jgi:ectoine hydroxylase-related dioxygenase (phytanoyl-CoA dioxygenase family)
MAIASFEEAFAAAGADRLTPSEAQALDREGYIILRGAIPPDLIVDLRQRFEENFVPHDKWPMPRERDTRHAMLDEDDVARRVCLSPRVLAVLAHMFGQRFFLADIQGRDPRPNGGYQKLHRDWPEAAPEYVVGLAFIDSFGAHNGATRLVPGTHAEPGGMDDYSHYGEFCPNQMIVAGEAGDFLLFHGRLVHSGMRNISGAPRRSLQISYKSWSARETHRECRRVPNATEVERYLMGIQTRDRIESEPA